MRFSGVYWRSTNSPPDVFAATTFHFLVVSERDAVFRDEAVFDESRVEGRVYVAR
jgi:hypothetical protein